MKGKLTQLLNLSNLQVCTTVMDSANIMAPLSWMNSECTNFLTGRYKTHKFLVLFVIFVSNNRQYCIYTQVCFIGWQMDRYVSILHLIKSIWGRESVFGISVYHSTLLYLSQTILNRIHILMWIFFSLWVMWEWKWLER